MLFVALIVIVVVAVGAFILVKQQQKVIAPNKNKNHQLIEPRNIFNLQIGDIVQYMDVDWFVEGKLTYNEDGYIWFEYLLQDGDNIRWLSVDEDDMIEVALLEQANTLDVSQRPPEELNFAGNIYRCTDSGNAIMKRTGTTLRRTGERCQYFDYESNNNKVLSIEFWNGEIEVTVGERINPRGLTLLPGDGKGVYREV